MKNRSFVLIASVLFFGTLAYTQSPGVQDATAIPKPTAFRPHPRDFVVLDQDCIAAGCSPIPGGESAALYAVPPNRWLVITDLQVHPDGSPQFELICIHPNTEITVKRNRLHLSIDNNVLNNFITYWSSSTGLAFPPGSTVAIRNTISSPLSLRSYNLVGYLVND